MTDILEAFKSVFSLKFMEGFRTYFMGLIMILQAVLGLYSGESDIISIINDPNLFEGLFGAGLMTLRAGIANK
jgi:hypothetical protein